MSPGLAFEAAKDAAEALGPVTDPLLFAVAAALIAAAVLSLLLGGRAHRDADGALDRLEGLVADREGPEGGTP